MTIDKSIRRPLIAGNWKMNLDLKASVELVRALTLAMPKDFQGEVMVAPPYTALAVVGEALRNSPIRLGAQDLFWEEKGAFTGEVSASQLKDAGCWSVLIGHSERRRIFAETDAAVHRKLEAALKAGLIPVVCVGETLEEREAQRTWRVLETQVKGGLAGFAPSALASLVVAYEPVWAIGTGKTATPGQAQEAHLFIRKQAAALYGPAFASGLRILYGGSVTAENIDSLMAEPDIDGALVGGASLKADSFSRIVGFRSPAAR